MAGGVPCSVCLSVCLLCFALWVVLTCELMKPGSSRPLSASIWVAS